MGFDLGAELAAVRGQGYDLHCKYLNAQLPRSCARDRLRQGLRARRGRLPVRRRGQRATRDFLSGFGVFAARPQPPGDQARRCMMRSTPTSPHGRSSTASRSWGCSPQRLLAKRPGPGAGVLLQQRHRGGRVGAEVRPPRDRQGPDRLRAPRLPRADRRVAVRQRRGGVQARASARCCPAPRFRLATSTRSRPSCARATWPRCIIEPIQGHGVHDARPPGSWRTPRRCCKKHGALLICDEVQAGLGRTGQFFAYQHDGVQPDIVTVAKALSGGYVPVGAMLTTDKIFGSVYSVHGQGHGPLDRRSRAAPLAMAAGLAALAVIEDEGLVENADAGGDELMRGLRATRGQVRPDQRRARRGPDDRHRVRQARPALQGKAGWAMLQKAARGPVRADGRRATVPAAPDPHPGLRRPHGGHQADPAADDRRRGGQALRRRARRRARRRVQGVGA